MRTKSSWFQPRSWTRRAILVARGTELLGVWPFIIQDPTLSLPTPTRSVATAMHPLRDKVVLITGGSSGIGRATALRLAGHGACVAVAARHEGALAETASQAIAQGALALAIPTDVTDADQCRRAVEATVAHFGRLDILVCSAGISMRAY